MVELSATSGGVSGSACEDRDLGVRGATPVAKSPLD